MFVAVRKTVEKCQETPRVLTACLWEKVVNYVIEDDTILRAMPRFKPVQQIVLIRQAHFVPMAGVGKYKHELQRNRDPNVPVAAEALALASFNVSLHELPLHVLRRFGREQIHCGRRELAGIVPKGVNQGLVPQPRIGLLVQDV